MAANFVRAVQGKAQPLSRPEEAVALMRIVDALYKSARTGRPVRVGAGHDDLGGPMGRLSILAHFRAGEINRETSSD